MRVDSEQDVPKRRQIGFRGKGQSPRSRHGVCVACLHRIQSIEVQASERDVPPFHPIGILEGGPVDGFADGPGGALVGAEKEPMVRLAQS